MNISLIIPTHNRKDLLGQTLDSLCGVRAPSGTSFETIVVANACTDGTEEFVNGLTSYPHSLRVVSEPEAGLNPARNRGVREAKHEWIAFIDDDVWVNSNWMVGLVDAVEKSGADFIGGHVELWWRDAERPAWLTQQMEWILSNNECGDELKQIGPVGGLVGANFACRSSVL